MSFLIKIPLSFIKSLLTLSLVGKLAAAFGLSLKVMSFMLLYRHGMSNVVWDSVPAILGYTILFVLGARHLIRMHVRSMAFITSLHLNEPTLDAPRIPHDVEE